MRNRIAQQHRGDDEQIRKLRKTQFNTDQDPDGRGNQFIRVYKHHILIRNIIPFYNTNDDYGRESTWCLTCETSVNNNCSSFGHVAIKLPVNAVRNFEQLSDIFENVQAKKQAELANYEQQEIELKMKTAPENLDDKTETNSL